jgi:drug/metabolite transporter (DMT)-like permease
MNLQPIVGLLLAATLLGERVSPGQVAGGLLVLGGVALTTRERI